MNIINPKMLYYGFPVILLTTLNGDKTTNITPISSSWVLGNDVIIGISIESRAYENLIINKGLVLNIADSSLWSHVETISRYTGKEDMPIYKKNMGYRYAADKFSIGGLTPEKSMVVEPLRIKECQLQIECIVEKINNRADYAIVELKVQTVHAKEEIILEDEYIDPKRWNPLIYNFRSYHGLSKQLGINFKGNK